MILIIVGALIVLYTLPILIGAIRNRIEIPGILLRGVLITAVAWGISFSGVAIALNIGYNTMTESHIASLLERRETVLKEYMDDPCYHHYTCILTYNADVDTGNSLFCRFDHEDRSMYKVDIHTLPGHEQFTDC